MKLEVKWGHGTWGFRTEIPTPLLCKGGLRRIFLSASAIQILMGTIRFLYPHTLTGTGSFPTITKEHCFTSFYYPNL